jgi:hypothetical protein
MPDVHLIDEGIGNGDGTRESQKPDWSELFSAPDLSQFVKRPKTDVAREYERKAAAMLKAGLVTSVNAQQFPDAAAFLYHGPGVAAAVGTLAEADERARRAIDLIATPANPYSMFVMAALPLVAQLIRNHEPEIKQTRETRRAQRKARKSGELPPPEGQARIKLPFGWSVPIRFRFKFNAGKLLAGFRTQTQPPEKLAYMVFADEKVVNELRKQGIILHPEKGE